MSSLTKVTENVWVMRYPLNVMGTHVGRTVTLLRVGAGDLVVHSTAPFTKADKVEIEKVGKPQWLIEATLLHDTYAKEGQGALPEVPYYPADKLGGLKIPDIEILELRGMPRVREHAMYHVPSRSLIVADLLFNWGPGATGWEGFVRRRFMGIAEWPGMSKFFKFCIKDREAFKESLHTVLAWPFERVIVGHGEIIEDRKVFEAGVRRAGF